MRIKICDVNVGTRKRKLSEERVRELAESISELGLLQPIGIRADGTLVFGWHRLEACRLLGWEEIDAVLVDGQDALRAELAEIDENLIRNELTVLERAEHLARRKEIYETLHPETKKGVAQAVGMHRVLGHNVTDTVSVTFADDTAAKTGLSPRTIRRDVQVATKLVPEVKEAIRETPLADAKKDLLRLARLDAEMQKRVARMVVEGKAKDVDDALRKIRKQERIAELERQIDAIKSGNVAVPVGLFDVIVVDPPWPYGTQYDPHTRRAASPYPEMSLEEIRAIRLPAKEDCVLWLWTTHLFMRHAFAILDAWGFREVAILTWVKDRLGLGSWLRSKSEFCIMAVKGQPVVDLTNQSTVLFAPMREHSRKPDEFYEMVETLCPGRKLDYFSREPRPGWEQYGNDVERFKSNCGGNTDETGLARS